MILYIHGFNSSPKSVKAIQTVQYLNQHFPQTDILVPQVPSSVVSAVKMLDDIIVKNQLVIKGVVGSSLGGYLASYFVEKYSVKSVVVNPAVRPYELLADYLGSQTNPYTGEQFELSEQHMIELKCVDTPNIARHDHYWLLQQTGDEVLDFRQAVAKYANCKQTVEQGGDHSFQGYQRFLPEIARFFGLTNES